MINNNAIITKADKGNSIVIMYHNIYEQKLLNFIACNGTTETDDNITNVFQKELRRTLNDCQLIVDNNNKWRLINLNPDAPVLRGLIKIHKETTPIRPIINSKTLRHTNWLKCSRENYKHTSPSGMYTSRILFN
jgi:hypothetical protein